MLDKFKSKWLMMKPSHKTASMYIIGLLFLVIVIFGFSNEPIKKIIKVNTENEIGAFEVNDEAVTLEALGTQIKAQNEQINLLQAQLSASNSDNLKTREIVRGLSGSDQNIRSFNELSRKVGRVEEMILSVANKQELIGGHETEEDVVVVEEDIADAPDVIVTGTQPQSNQVDKKTPIAQLKPVISNRVSKTKIPDDPLAFIKSVSKGNDTEKTGNMFVNTEENKVLPTSRRQAGNVKIVTSEDVESVDDSSSESEYVGERLLAGSLIPVVVVSGVDAPTGKAAEKGAISSTLRITGPAILPNGYRVDLTGCLVTTDVRGDSATERAYFRPNRLTCHYDYGSVDVPLQGYISGKDGVQGFRGRVVSKQGKALFYGAIAGGIGGVAKAFGGGNTSNSASMIVGGSTNPYDLPDSDQVAQAAAAGSISDSAEFLADYYKSKLDQLYEVIEIKPLIKGSIHILKTFQLDLLEQIDASKNPKNKRKK